MKKSRLDTAFQRQFVSVEISGVPSKAIGKNQVDRFDWV